VRLFLMALFGVVTLLIIYIVITTSLESSLFKEWDYLGGIPWMRATLWDFYANVLVLSAWVCYKESKLWKKIIWIILFCVLGSIATCTYVLIQLLNIKDGKPLKAVFTQKN
jgi:lipopolysaccharide/colanic/teichoic acid biosynthesis glycosyltransferase